MSVTSLVVPAPRVRRRPAGTCRAGQGCDQQVWLVTSANHQPHVAPRQPWGTCHLKSNGGLLTACGEYAVGWPVFWDRRIDPADPAVCRACLRVATQAATARPSTFPTTERSRA